MTDEAIRELVRLAANGLGRMRSVEDPLLFAHEIAGKDARPRGTSLRYSLMVLLGTSRAEEHGIDCRTDRKKLWRRLLERVDSPQLTRGDVGLYLWNAARLGASEGPQLLQRVKTATENVALLRSLEGMEVAWLMIGLVEYARVFQDDAARRLAENIGRFLFDEMVSLSGLLYQHGKRDLRRPLPNFATQIYGLLALSMAARAGLEDAPERYRQAAVRLAEAMLRSQLSDGGWPWIFSADEGVVVEPYEIYSVHQDAMAPMALLALYRLTQDARYLEISRKSVDWIFGQNELGQNMLQDGHGFIFRSIRRRKPWDRLTLWSQSGLAIVRSKLPRGLPRVPNIPVKTPVEINRTCRPYHLGWILEAWSGVVSK
ncbi:MAG: hypothetical protein GYA21_01865 [Myxococcales bacterium]|nr:hypothetical protein [Myxococcales bacterium]